MAQPSWWVQVLRLLARISIYFAIRLQLLSMTLTGFAHGLMYYTGATNSGGRPLGQNLAVRNGPVTMTAHDHAIIRQHVLEEIASELSEDAKPKVFH